MPKTRKEPQLLSSKTAEMLRRIERAKAGGGPEKAKAQKERGKLLARERIDLLLDDESFQEIDLLVERRADGSATPAPPTDGVITGFGRIHGRGVAVYAQDFTIMGGSLGLAHAMKICKIM